MPPKKSPLSSRSTAVFRLSVAKEGLEPILGAAYLMTDRAFVSLDGDRSKKITVALRPKESSSAGGLKALGDRFSRELATQKVRWAIAKNNQPIREFVAEQAVLLANGRLEPAPRSVSAGPAEEKLTSDQRAEIEKLIAEVEDEIKLMNQKKAVPDPKNIKASWEEKQETKRKGEKA